MLPDGSPHIDETVITSGGSQAPGWAWIGIGSNVGDRWLHLREAVRALAPHVRLVSPVYETQPWGVLEQPNFLNAVMLLRWPANAWELLALCKRVELDLGRRERVRNGPRELDLDILLLGTEVHDSPWLTVPHPGFPTRRSVLEPWGDVAGDLIPIGGTETIRDLRARQQSAPGQAVWLAERPPTDPSSSADVVWVDAPAADEI